MHFKIQCACDNLHSLQNPPLLTEYVYNVTSIMLYPSYPSVDQLQMDAGV